MKKKKQPDLSVVTKAKDLCRYVMSASQKSLKQYRFTFSTRLQNMSLDIIEYIYRANDTYVDKRNDKDWKSKYRQRLDLMRDFKLQRPLLLGRAPADVSVK